MTITVFHGHKEHGSTHDECAVPGHNYLLLASLEEGDCDDFQPRGETDG